MLMSSTSGAPCRRHLRPDVRGSLTKFEEPTEMERLLVPDLPEVHERQSRRSSEPDGALIRTFPAL
jgi:hypothetical protein